MIGWVRTNLLSTASASIAATTPNKGWYRDVGQGMGATLNRAAAINAYTLTDRGAWANFNNGQGLEILTEVDSALFNPYGSILVNSGKWPSVKFGDAKIWYEWLTTKPGLDAIVSYRINGEDVFFPPRASEQAATSPTLFTSQRSFSLRL
jgi:tungstate transport system substrate-binding protein